MNITNFFSNINPKEVLKNLPDAVFVVDFDGKIVWVNNKAANMFETNTGFLKSLLFDELVNNGLELAEKSYRKRNAVFAKTTTINENEIFIELNAKKYVEQYFVTIRDITALTNILNSAEEVSKLNNEKNLMLSKLSNEIKSPLQSIVGFSQALIDGLGGDINDKQEKYIKIINKNSGELLFFLDRLIEFSQIESSLISLSNNNFDIVNIIQGIVKNNEQLINQKKLTITYDFENFDKKSIYTNEAAVRIILRNILETSVKNTESGGITIKLDYPEEELVEKIFNIKEDKFLRITFNDTGIGFTKSELTNLFEPYAQLDKANKKSIYRSITLGSASKLVQKLGGAIWVQSEVMKGTSFFIILPIEGEI